MEVVLLMGVFAFVCSSYGLGGFKQAMIGMKGTRTVHSFLTFFDDENSFEGY